MKEPPEQIGSGALSSITGVGLTVISNSSGGPVQETPPFVKVGVTVIVATIVALVLFTVVNGFRLPDPDNPAPISVFICQA